MPQKLLEIWTRQEILSLINEVNMAYPFTTREYRHGWEDACKKLYARILGKDYLTEKDIK